MLSAKLPFRISGDVTVSVRRLNDFNQWMNGRGDLDDPKEYVQDCADMGLINLRNCKSQVQNAIEELLKESSSKGGKRPMRDTDDVIDVPTVLKDKLPTVLKDNLEFFWTTKDASDHIKSKSRKF